MLCGFHGDNIYLKVPSFRNSLQKRMGIANTKSVRGEQATTDMKRVIIYCQSKLRPSLAMEPLAHHQYISASKKYECPSNAPFA